MGKTQFNWNQYRSPVMMMAGLALVFCAGDAMAAGLTLGGMASNVIQSFTSLTKLVTASAYLAGMGFAVGAIIKFKAHKDAPQQTPIGQPIGLLMVAAALLFLPTILSMAGATMFGSSGGNVGGPTGTVFSG